MFGGPCRLLRFLEPLKAFALPRLSQFRPIALPHPLDCSLLLQPQSDTAKRSGTPLIRSCLVHFPPHHTRKTHHSTSIRRFPDHDTASCCVQQIVRSPLVSIQSAPSTRPLSRARVLTTSSLRSSLKTSLRCDCCKCAEEGFLRISRFPASRLYPPPRTHCSSQQHIPQHLYAHHPRLQPQHHLIHTTITTSISPCLRPILDYSSHCYTFSLCAIAYTQPVSLFLSLAHTTPSPCCRLAPDTHGRD